MLLTAQQAGERMDDLPFSGLSFSAPFGAPLCPVTIHTIKRYVYTICKTYCNF